MWEHEPTRAALLRAASEGQPEAVRIQARKGVEGAAPPHSQPTAYDSHAPQPTVPPSRGLRATGGQHAAHTTADSGADAHGSRGLALGGGSRADRRRAAAAHARTRASGRTPVRLCLLRHRLHTPAPAAPVLPAVLAHRTLIFGPSATSRVDSAPAHFSSHFCARASPSKRFPAPQGAILSAPRSGRKF